MHRYESLAALPKQPRLLALGNFDGVHRGHRVLLAQVREQALRLDISAAALVFEPHPQEILQPQKAPKLLTLPAERAELIEALGFEELISLAFTPEVAALSPEAFVEQILIDHCQVRGICVGDNYRFGCGGQGDTLLLQELADRHGIALQRLPLMRWRGKVISSSEIRQLLQAGDIGAAEEMLGHAYCLSGQVVHGSKLARRLGFPTANIAVSKRKLWPRYGAYSAVVQLKEGRFDAVVNIGLRPSVEGDTPTAEAHLLGYEGDLYGREMRVCLRRFLRPEQRFATLEELKEQVMLDIAALRQEIGPEA